ncbi:MAG TPA: DCC1-like thiol-disulfide oxidoreductase family protein [Gemmatimonadales bacterium]
MNGPIIYFDGLCNLCDGFVRFLVARDRRGRYRFAPLQGDTARTRLEGRFTGNELETLVLEEPRRFRIRSDAALEILSGLGGLWHLAVVLRIVPRPLRDALYDYVARKRFAWYGRRDACRIPTPDEARRFLP